ncbi:respiratory nitrate reductase subunit beta [Denitratisoma oestradiolicum]|nr:respiratory nitrate reductase subunit beta [Denitratisoma oestradiolicum]
MVFDLNKCLGCHTCSIACKTQWTNKEGMEGQWWSVVNTMPGKGTPKGWEQMGGGFEPDGKARPGIIPIRQEHGDAWKFNHKEVMFEGGGKTSHLHPMTFDDKDPNWGPNWDEDQGDGEYPNSYYFYLPRLCNHCTHPACVEACPRGSIYKREQDGVVLIDDTKCKGFRFCMEACPYKRIYFNHVRQVSQKCIFCYPRVEAGVAPACARQCPGRLRFVGYLDDETAPIHKLIYKYKVALPLHAEYGTQPNVYYIPPLSPPEVDMSGNVKEGTHRIPTDYLRTLFGPNVDSALATMEKEMEKKRAGEKSELLDTLIVYEWPKDIFPDFIKSPADVPGDFHAR